MNALEKLAKRIGEIGEEIGKLKQERGRLVSNISKIGKTL